MIRDVFEVCRRRLLLAAFVAIGLLCLCIDLLAQSSVNPITNGLDKIAQDEVARRGNRIERTGTIRSGLMAEALSPPEDDSHKWFLTLVGRSDEDRFTRMRSEIKLSHEMAPWVNVDEPSKSHLHYQVRCTDDATQADWLNNAKLQESLKTHGTPAVILQPPLNKRFGDPSTIVKLIHGEMTGADLSKRLRQAIVDYVEAIPVSESALVGYPNRSQQSRGGNAEPQLAGIKAPPPFPIPDQRPNNVQPNPLPVEIPPPQSLTAEQIKALAPGADAEFVLAILSEKITDPQIVKLRWEVAQAKKPTPVVPAPIDDPPAENPSKPASEIPQPMLAWGIAALLAVILLGRIVTNAIGSVITKTNDIQKLIERLKEAEKNQSPPS